MSEIKGRLAYVGSSIAGDTDFDGLVRRETSFLQLRLICELVALSSLAAHGDVEGARSSKTRSEYSARRIIETMGRLHPDFYPQPVNEIKTAEGKYELRAIADGHLKQDDLLRLYERCGAVLHRGNIMNRMASMLPTPTTAEEVVEALNKIMTLLNIHTIVHKNAKRMFICSMRTADRDEVTITELAVLDSTPD